MSRILRASLVLVVLLCASRVLLSHDQLLADFVGRYNGPGFNGSATTSLGSGVSTGSPSIDFPRSNATLLSWIPLSDFGVAQENGNDCWGYTSPSGTEYAILGMHAGTGFVRLTDPGAPEIVMTVGGVHSFWRDMKVYGEFCYVVSEGALGPAFPNGGGIQVMDLTQIDSNIVTLVNTILTPGIENTHNVAIDEDSGYLYRVGGASRGLRAYNLADPANPVYEGAYDERYVHDAQIVTYTSGPAAGRQIAFCSAGLGSNGDMDPSVDIVDVTDKANMFLLQRVYYPNPGYSHQAWLSEDRQFLYVNDEFDEDGVTPTTTHILDVSTPATASYVATFDNGNTAVGHNLYVNNGLIYEANYRSGVRVFETSNPLAPTEIAYFDSYLDDDNPNFNGIWSVYPFFESEVVIASDIEKGLFVLWFGDPLLSISYPNGIPTNFDPAGESVLVHIQEQGGGVIDTGTEFLHVDFGGGFTDIPLVPLGGGDYSADFPATPCGDEIQWFVSARSTNGVRWKDVEAAPSESRVAVAATSIELDVSDDIEAPMGWTVGAPSDTATTGVWENGDPNGTSAQPEDDHTDDPGTDCWFTGQSAPGALTGTADVDNGATTLMTPIYDLSNAETAQVSYWRWYSNDLFGNVDDSFVVEITSDGGSNWVTLETIGPGSPEASGGWFQANFTVESFVSLTDQVALRFIADDSGNGSWVEAAIDDVRVEGYRCSSSVGINSCSGDGGDGLGCTDCPCSNNATPGTIGGCLNSAATSTRLTVSGDPSVSLPSGSMDDLRFALVGAPATSFCILNSGDAVAPTNMANPCFGLDSGTQSMSFDGLRCAVGNTRRHGGRSANGLGEVGTSSPPWGGEGGPPLGIANAGGSFAASQTRFFQVIHREDPLLGCQRGLNTSQAIQITFQP